MFKKIFILVNIFVIIFCNMVIVSFAMDDLDYPGVEVPYYPKEEQWGLSKINIEQAWSIATGNEDIMVAVIDSGISTETSDLSTRVDTSLSKSFLDANELYEGVDGLNELIPTYNDPTYDILGHGTHVAGIIGANGLNRYGISGVCQNVKLVSLKVVDRNYNIDSEDLEEAIRYAEFIGADIINYSAGGYDYYPNIINAIRDFSGLFICAAGNEGNDNDVNSVYPGCFELDNIIVVGASDENDARSVFDENDPSDSSNYGKYSVDLFAPGSNILSMFPSNVCDEYAYENPNELEQSLIDFHNSLHYSSNMHYGYGSSSAVPFVSGVAALLLSMDNTLTSLSIKNIILTNVDKITGLKNLCLSGGRLNAYKVLQSSNHTHNVAMKYYDRSRHINTCLCGYVEGDFGSHAISSTQANMLMATCLGCNQVLNMRVDIANVVLGINQNNVVTENGSYMLNNGILVLVPEDVEAYINGNLKFIELNESI